MTRMNVKRLKELEQEISKLDDDLFIMNLWVSGIEFEPDGTPAFCKTACCIGGRAVIKWGTRRQIEDLIYSGRAYNNSVDVLGLTTKEANRLFFQQSWKIPYDGKIPLKECAVLNIRRTRRFWRFKRIFNA